MDHWNIPYEARGEKVLVNFVKKINPGGPGWKKYSSGLQPKWSLPNDILKMFLGIFSVYSCLLNEPDHFIKTILGYIFVVFSAIGMGFLFNLIEMINISTPSKLSFGEHQDYLGLPVAATSISLRSIISGKKEMTNRLLSIFRISIRKRCFILINWIIKILEITLKVVSKYAKNQE